MGVDGIDVARAHKILHYKWPRVFPLIDNRTLIALSDRRAWFCIHTDLTRDDGIWSDLELTVSEVLARGGGAPREGREIRSRDQFFFDFEIGCHERNAYSN